jgi:type 1 fimbria pilin
VTDTTVIIKTIGRKTLNYAINSAKLEGFDVIVVADGCEIPPGGDHQVVTLGRKWGYYGGMAANVGAALAKTEFITFLDDDDEFLPGAGKHIRKKLKRNTSVDVWIGGVKFQHEVQLMDQGKVTYKGNTLACDSSRGVVPGNVAMPTYRTSIFSKIPFADHIPPENINLIDYAHIAQCQQAGYKIDWFGRALYNVRPRDERVNGAGQL